MKSIIRPCYLAVSALLALAAPALAADEFAIPEGCAPILNVHSVACEVNVIWTCDMAPAGDKWEAQFYTEGLQSIVSYSGQYAWIDSEYYWDNSTEEAYGTPADPISMSMLVLNGEDTYDFQMRRTDPDGTRIMTVTGTDTMTGEDATIDGQAMQVMAYDFDIREEDGSLYYSASGTQYFSSELQMFFAGQGTARDIEGPWNYDSTPAKILFPDDLGFGKTTPSVGCDPTSEPTPKPDSGETPTGPIESGTGKNNDK